MPPPSVSELVFEPNQRREAPLTMVRPPAAVIFGPRGTGRRWRQFAKIGLARAGIGHLRRGRLVLRRVVLRWLRPWGTAPAAIEFGPGRAGRRRRHAAVRAFHRRRLSLVNDGWSHCKRERRYGCGSDEFLHDASSSCLVLGISPAGNAARDRPGMLDAGRRRHRRGE
jgi:hypothetical protein